MFKSGYVAIVGRPNVGKSTLLNALVGEKIAAVTDKPQTTRHKILGIKTSKEGQLLFLDTPGIHKPHKSLNESMMEAARRATDEVDLFLFMVEPDGRRLAQDRQVFELIRPKRKPIFLLINKIDTVGPDRLLPLIKEYDRTFHPEAIFPISATRKKGLKEIENLVFKKLHEGPAYFPEDQVSDITERFIASEVIREKAMELLREEIPYALAVVIEAYQEPKDAKRAVRVRASLVVEKESQKGIVIGKGGSMIKRIGQRARQELERRLGVHLFLELFVRVEPDWTKDPSKVREFVGC